MMEHHLLLLLVTARLSSQTLQVANPTTPGPICDDSKLYPDRISCRNYYRCLDGKLIQETCPVMNEFSPVYYWCLPSKLAQCSLKNDVFTLQKCVKILNDATDRTTSLAIPNETATSSDISTDSSPCDPSKDRQCSISTSKEPNEATSSLITSEATKVTSVPNLPSSLPHSKETPLMTPKVPELTSSSLKSSGAPLTTSIPTVVTLIPDFTSSSSQITETPLSTSEIPDFTNSSSQNTGTPLTTSKPTVVTLIPDFTSSSSQITEIPLSTSEIPNFTNSSSQNTGTPLTTSKPTVVTLIPDFTSSSSQITKTRLTTSEATLATLVPDFTNSSSQSTETSLTTSEVTVVSVLADFTISSSQIAETPLSTSEIPDFTNLSSQNTGSPLTTSKPTVVTLMPDFTSSSTQITETPLSISKATVVTLVPDFTSSSSQSTETPLTTSEVTLVTLVPDITSSPSQSTKTPLSTSQATVVTLVPDFTSSSLQSTEIPLTTSKPTLVTLIPDITSSPSQSTKTPLKTSGATVVTLVPDFTSSSSQSTKTPLTTSTPTVVTLVPDFTSSSSQSTEIPLTTSKSTLVTLVPDITSSPSQSTKTPLKTSGATVVTLVPDLSSSSPQSTKTPLTTSEVPDLPSSSSQSTGTPLTTSKPTVITLIPDFTSSSSQSTKAPLTVFEPTIVTLVSDFTSSSSQRTETPMTMSKPTIVTVLPDSTCSSSQCTITPLITSEPTIVTLLPDSTSSSGPLTPNSGLTESITSNVFDISSIAPSSPSTSDSKSPEGEKTTELITIISQKPSTQPSTEPYDEKYCIENEMESDPTNCQKFYLCINRTWNHKKCPIYMEFSTFTMTCVPDFLVQCSIEATTSSTSGISSDTSSVPISTTSRSEDIVTDMTRTFTSSQGLLSPDSLVKGKSEITTEKRVSASKKTPYCVENMVYPNPGNCREYYVCENGNLKSKACPGVQEFSFIYHSCLPPIVAGCIEYTIKDSGRQNICFEVSENYTETQHTTIRTEPITTSEATTIMEISTIQDSANLNSHMIIESSEDHTEVEESKQSSEHYGEIVNKDKFQETFNGSEHKNETEHSLEWSSSSLYSNESNQSTTSPNNTDLLNENEVDNYNTSVYPTVKLRSSEESSESSFDSLELSYLAKPLNIQHSESLLHAYFCHHWVAYPNPEDCTKYYTCVQGTLVDASCPENEEFDEDLQKCLPIDEAQCIYKNFLSNVDSVEPWWIGSAKTFPRTVSNKKYISDPFDCGYYLACNLNKCTRVPCTKGLEYSRTESKCLPASEANCSKRGTYNLANYNRIRSTRLNRSFRALKSLLSNLVEIFDTAKNCTFNIKDPVYFLANNDDCTRFNVCSFGNLYEAKCPRDYGFSTKDKNCLPVDQVDCQTRKPKTALRQSLNSYSLSPAIPNTKLTPNNEPIGDVNNADFNEDTCTIVENKPVYFMPDNNCRKFKICLYGHLYEAQCPYDYEFNERESKCLPPGPKPCKSNTNTPQPNKYVIASVDCPQEKDKLTLYSDPLNCEYYFTCNNGASSHQRCPGGEEFSKTKLICMPALEAKCSHYGKLKSFIVTDNNKGVVDKKESEIGHGSSNYKNNYFYHLASDNYVLHRLRRSLPNDSAKIEEKKTQEKEINTDNRIRENSEEIADDTTAQKDDKELDAQRSTQQNDDESEKNRRAHAKETVYDNIVPDEDDFNSDYIDDEYGDTHSDIFLSTLNNLLSKTRDTKNNFIESKAK